MKLWDADTPDEKVETDAGVESCENPKSRFEINRDIPSETERNQSNFSASGMALNLVTLQPEKISQVNRTAGKVSNQMAGHDRLPVPLFARNWLACVFILCRGIRLPLFDCGPAFVSVLTRSGATAPAGCCVGVRSILRLTKNRT